MLRKFRKRSLNELYYSKSKLLIDRMLVLQQIKYSSMFGVRKEFYINELMMYI